MRVEDIVGDAEYAMANLNISDTPATQKGNKQLSHV